VRLSFPEGYLCMSAELSPWVIHSVLLDHFVDEKTEVLYDQNEIVRRVLEQCYTVKYTVDSCIDVNSLYISCQMSGVVSCWFSSLSNGTS